MTTCPILWNLVPFLDYLSWECKKKGVEGDNIRLSGPYSGPDIWSFAKRNNNLRLQNSLQGSGENMGSLGIISPGQPSFLQRGPQSLEHRQSNSGPFVPPASLGGQQVTMTVNSSDVHSVKAA